VFSGKRGKNGEKEVGAASNLNKQAHFYEALLSVAAIPFFSLAFSFLYLINARSLAR